MARVGLALVVMIVTSCSGSDGDPGVAATGGASGSAGAGGETGGTSNGGSSNAGGAGGGAGGGTAGGSGNGGSSSSAGAGGTSSVPPDAGDRADGDAAIDAAVSDGSRDVAAQPEAAGPKDAPTQEAGTKTILGVYVGNSTADVLAHEAWLGRQVDGILGYTGAASWTDYDGSVGWAAGSSMWGGIDRRVLWSVPLFPTGASLAEAASGAYDDAHYKKAAGILKDFRPAEPVIHIRTAWEFNGNWFPWQCISSSCLADSIGAFRHFVTSFRSASARFRFTFCPNVGPANATYPLEDSYPGDEYVDVIGIDLYAGWYPGNAATPEQRWQYEIDRPYGLKWLVSFAKTHGKPIAIPEWGVGDNGSGDDPVFVKGMHDFCDANGCIYMSYWDSNADYKGELRAGQYPNAAAAYKTQLGHQ